MYSEIIYLKKSDLIIPVLVFAFFPYSERMSFEDNRRDERYA
jgi:hypothetical protein